MGRELGIVGADTRGTQGDSLPSAGSQFFDPLWVDGRYAWDWRGMGLCYPLMRAFGRRYVRAGQSYVASSSINHAVSGSSLNATWLQAPAFDAETHEQSTSARRTHNSLAIHSAAASWLLHAMGIAVHSVWYWGRDEYGGVASATWPNVSDTERQSTNTRNTARSSRDAILSLIGNEGSGFPYSYLTAPAAVDAAARTQAAVNSVSNDIAFLATGTSASLPGLETADRVCGLFSLPSKVRTVGHSIFCDATQ